MFENFLALNASAGSGKTFNLAVRFIELILQGAKINQILALTFTKKAANEMKERIIKNFLELENNEAQISQIQRDLGLSKEQILQIRNERKNDFLNVDLQISTFDSFFNKILKLFSLHSGLNPNFSMSEKILKSQQNFFINEISSDPNELEALANFVSNSDNKKGNLLANLDFFQENNIEISSTKKAKFPSTENISKILNELRNFCETNGYTSRCCGIFEERTKISEIMKISALEKKSLDEHSWFKKVYENPSKFKADELDDKFKALKFEIKNYLDELENYHLSEIGNLVEKYKQSKLNFNRQNAKLTFNDIVGLVYELLCAKDKIDKDLLYFRLDSKITHLLIDEFQDTNILQYEILFPLISEIVAGYGQNGLGSFFYVGDIKQSIYSFRGGKKELFGELQKDFSQIKANSLDTNYRSAKLLVDFVNSVFVPKIKGYEIQKSSANVDEISQTELENAKKYIEQNPNFPLFEIKNDSFGYLAIKENDEILEEAVNQVKFLLDNGVNSDDIAILCWKNDDCEALKDMLGAQSIAVTLNSKKLVSQTPKVASIIEYAKFCLSGKKIHLENIHALTGTKPKELSVDLSQNSLNSAKFIAEILEFNLCDEDILLFFQAVEKYKNLIEYIYSNDDTSAFSQVGSGVKLMTVHKSKGLEFNSVIVCDKITKGNSDKFGFLSNYDFDKRKWQIKYNIKGRELVDDEYKNFKENLKNLEKEENINKLYVAFTRAKQNLIIIKKQNPKGDNPSYFTPYPIGSNKDKVIVDDYLNLPVLQYGYIFKSPIKTQIHSKKQEIILADIPRQSVFDDKTQKDDDGNFLVDENGKAVTNLQNQYFGSALHYTLEMCEKFDENSLEIALTASKNKFGKFLNLQSFESIKERVLNLIKNEQFKSLILGGKIYKEVPFKTQESEFRQIDLLVVKDSEILIFDYKSSDKFADENAAQVKFYKKALIGLYPNSQIKAFILFLKNSITEIREV